MSYAYRGYSDDDLEMEGADMGYSSPSDDEEVDEEAEENFRNHSGEAQEQFHGSYYFDTYPSSPLKRDEPRSTVQDADGAEGMEDELAGLTEAELAAMTEEELIWRLFDKERQKMQNGTHELGRQKTADDTTQAQSNIVNPMQVATVGKKLPNTLNTVTSMPSQDTVNDFSLTLVGEGITLPAVNSTAASRVSTCTDVSIPAPVPTSLPQGRRSKRPSGAGHGRYKNRGNDSRKGKRRGATTSDRVKSGRVGKGGPGRPKRASGAAPVHTRFSNVSLESRVSFLPLERRVTYGAAPSTVVERGPPACRRPCRHENKGGQCRKVYCKFLHRSQVGPFRGLLFSLPWSPK
ncbi:uncharacterized protein EI97DRAFT_432847 [Westerdykella ornata]|uniref:C3H1-type domain-containing protein n=1 Tax=Westerdykella ornata TaxID=318751 RepID=A0A6A6JKY5_WESOR|nr:uncharacterized protein EI97DRAFT_432847 [Westerdykella ornata]KAF2277251.1 hypothetical protein EI97DRAFT_432847 [Westerdykella ornata]